MKPLELRAIVSPYETPDNRRAFFQLANTLMPFFAFWALALWSWNFSVLLFTVFTLGVTAMMMRIFVLMHDCGHGSLFKTQSLNRSVGFVLGVLCGMPQLVWSARHAYHHSTNGNWEKYGGPLGTIPVEKYENFPLWKKYVFVYSRHWAVAPLGGFIYLVFNPRYLWLKGSIQYVIQKGKVADPYWKNSRGYWHMTANNVIFVLACIYMPRLVNPTAFFIILFTSLSLAGAVGLFLFTAQHNFEDSYASGNEGWDYYQAALEGTSFLIFPPILNWLTADIAYHHVHHLSSRIPNYRLRQCHEKNVTWFTHVKRIELKDVFECTRTVLWCKKQRKVLRVPDLYRPARLELSRT